MGDRIRIDGDYHYRALTSGNPVQRFWHKSKFFLIQELLIPTCGDVVLDVGCGSGVCSAYMAQQGARVVGVDGNQQAISFAKDSYRDELLTFQLGYVDELNFRNGTFTKAVCLEVVEHLYEGQVQRLLESVRDALARDGLLVISTPNYRSLWPLIEMTLDLFNFVPSLKEDQHVTKFTPARLRRLCESSGYELVRARTICTVGPWLALFSDKLAEAATRFELAHSFPAGTILAQVYRKK